MKKDLKLSERLKTIASFLSKEAFFADIGSDHAYLPCYVCLYDKQARAIAGEVSQGPYRRAIETVERYELEERIDVRLGNGLDVIDTTDEVKDLVIAGMGGGLISHILKDGKDKLSSLDRLILQPNNDAHLIRRLLLSIRYPLVKEVILEENNHIYEILVAERYNSTEAYRKEVNLEKQLIFGPLLLQEKSPVFLKKWQNEYEKMNKVTRQMKNAKNVDIEKVSHYQKQIKWMEEILS